MNPTFDVATFQATFPQFANTPAATIQAWVNLVLNSPMADWFQSTASLTDQQLMVAHIGFKLSQMGTGGDAQPSATVSGSQGSVSASFAPPPIQSGLEYYLASSEYGRMLWANIRISVAGGDIIGGLPERRAFRKVGGVFW